MHHIVYQLKWRTRRGRDFPARARSAFGRELARICRQRHWRLLELGVDGADITVQVRADPDTPARTVWYFLVHQTAPYLRQHYPEFRSWPSVWTRRYVARTLTPQETPHGNRSETKDRDHQET